MPVALWVAVVGSGRMPVAFWDAVAASGRITAASGSNYVALWMFNEKRAKPEEWAPATHVLASRNLAASCSAFSAPYPNNGVNYYCKDDKTSRCERMP